VDSPIPASTACYRPDATVTGIELSPAMLAIARQRAADLGLAADLREGDAEHLPFDDASFDTEVCALSLCTIPHPAAAIEEMYRVLVPDGTLLLVDHIGSSWPPIRCPMAVRADHDPRGGRAIHPPAAAAGESRWIPDRRDPTAQGRHGRAHPRP